MQMDKKAWKFYLTGRGAQEAMLKACKRAEKSIDLEQYIFNDDEVGRHFATVLMAKAKAGVRVRVLADVVGSHSLFVSDLSTDLSNAGVQIQFFNQIEPWWPYKIAQWFLRDHRKVMIVDGIEGWTGGVGLAAFMTDWRDTHVVVTGPVVEQMQESFNKLWMMARRGKNSVGLVPGESEGDMQFLSNAPKRHQRYIYYAILDAVKKAEHSICLTTPYFVPNRKLFRALRRAVRRGVVVKLLVPKSSDLRLVDLACQSYFWLTLRAGIRIFRYEPSMMHAKTVIVDGAWAMVGSCNLDNLSLILNYEDALVVQNEKCVADLQKHFEDDLKSAPELTQEVWHSRPIGDKFLESLTWPLHRLM